jgi:hypothetical protein
MCELTDVGQPSATFDPSWSDDVVIEMLDYASTLPIIFHRPMDRRDAR